MNPVNRLDTLLNTEQQSATPNANVDLRLGYQHNTPQKMMSTATKEYPFGGIYKNFNETRKETRTTGNNSSLSSLLPEQGSSQNPKISTKRDVIVVSDDEDEIQMVQSKPSFLMQSTTQQHPFHQTQQTHQTPIHFNTQQKPNSFYHTSQEDKGLEDKFFNFGKKLGPIQDVASMIFGIQPRSSQPTPYYEQQIPYSYTNANQQSSDYYTTSPFQQNSSYYPPQQAQPSFIQQSNIPQYSTQNTQYRQSSHERFEFQNRTFPTQQNLNTLPPPLEPNGFQPFQTYPYGRTPLGFPKPLDTAAFDPYNLLSYNRDDDDVRTDDKRLGKKPTTQNADFSKSSPQNDGLQEKKEVEKKKLKTKKKSTQKKSKKPTTTKRKTPKRKAASTRKKYEEDGMEGFSMEEEVEQERKPNKFRCETSENFLFSNRDIDMLSETAHRVKSFTEHINSEFEKRLREPKNGFIKPKDDSYIEIKNSLIDLNVYNHVKNIPEYEERKKKKKRDDKNQGVGIDAFEILCATDINKVPIQELERELKSSTAKPVVVSSNILNDLKSLKKKRRRNDSLRSDYQKSILNYIMNHEAMSDLLSIKPSRNKHDYEDQDEEEEDEELKQISVPKYKTNWKYYNQTLDETDIYSDLDKIFQGHFKMERKRKDKKRKTEGNESTKKKRRFSQNSVKDVEEFTEDKKSKSSYTRRSSRLQRKKKLESEEEYTEETVEDFVPSRVTRSSTRRQRRSPREVNKSKEDEEVNHEPEEPPSDEQIKPEEPPSEEVEDEAEKKKKSITYEHTISVDIKVRKSVVVHDNL